MKNLLIPHQITGPKKITFGVTLLLYMFLFTITFEDLIVSENNDKVYL